VVRVVKAVLGDEIAEVETVPMRSAQRKGIFQWRTH
jgi:hypothetical protein